MNLVLYCMLVLLRCRLVTPLSPPIPPTDVAVSSSAQLAQALQNSSIGFIYLSPQSKGVRSWQELSEYSRMSVIDGDAVQMRGGGEHIRLRKDRSLAICCFSIIPSV